MPRVPGRIESIQDWVLAVPEKAGERPVLFHYHDEGSSWQRVYAAVDGKCHKCGSIPPKSLTFQKALWGL